MQAGAQVAFSFIQFRTPTQRRRRQASRLGSLNCRDTMDTLRGSFLHNSKPTKWTLKMDQAKPPAGRGVCRALGMGEEPLPRCPYHGLF